MQFFSSIQRGFSRSTDKSFSPIFKNAVRLRPRSLAALWRTPSSQPRIPLRSSAATSEHRRRTLEFSAWRFQQFSTYNTEWTILQSILDSEGGEKWPEDSWTPVALNFAQFWAFRHKLRENGLKIVIEFISSSRFIFGVARKFKSALFKNKNVASFTRNVDNNDFSRQW